MSQKALAVAAGVSERTVYGYEKGDETGLSALLAVRKVLEARGCRFWEGTGEVGVTVRLAA